MNSTLQPDNRSGAPAGVLLNKAEAAKYLGIAPRTLDDWRQTRAIACIERPGYVRFLLRDLDLFIEQHRRESRGEMLNRFRSSRTASEG